MPSDLTVSFTCVTSFSCSLSFQVRKQLNERRDPSWTFTSLYLIKDSGACMLEGAGLWEDAFQEYVELETCYLDSLEQREETVTGDFGEAGYDRACFIGREQHGEGCCILMLAGDGK